MPVEATGPTIPKLQLKLFRIKKQKKALMLVASRLQNFMPNQFSCVLKGWSFKRETTLLLFLFLVLLLLTCALQAPARTCVSSCSFDLQSLARMTRTKREVARAQSLHFS